MTYPNEYQDAEHRRALGALMHDLEALPCVPAEEGTEGGDLTETVCDSNAGARDAIGQAQAEIHLRTVKRLEIEVPQQTAN